MSDGWIAWDRMAPPSLQKGPIGTEEAIREWVRRKEAWRKTQYSCKYEIAIRFEARRLITEPEQ